MPQELGISSLAVWLQHYNPTAPLALLQSSLESNQQLSLALRHLKTAIDTRETVGDRDHDAQQARQKIQTLRQSLSRLTTHANSLSDRLIQAEASLAARQQQDALQLQNRTEERVGMTALCSVWEGRWREERTLREDAEESLRNLKKVDGKMINDSDECSGDRLVVVKGSRKSRSAARPHKALTDIASGSSHQVRDESLSREEIIADLTNELGILRSEIREMSDSREAELARLTIELQLRRNEMSQLYASLDQILVLSPSPVIGTAEPRKKACKDVTDSRHPRNPSFSSLLDLSAVQPVTPPLQSLSDWRPVAGNSTREATGETVRLEEEIRDMERKIRQLSGAPESEGSSIDPEDGSDRAEEVVDVSTTYQILLRRTSELEDELESMENELAIANHERAVLRRQCEEMQQATAGNAEQAKLEETAQAYIGRLEADRSRLSRLLSASEAESHALSEQLSMTHSQVDDLSRRVRFKLEEQKDQLERAYDEIERLEEEIEHFKRRRELEDETF